MVRQAVTRIGGSFIETHAVMHWFLWLIIGLFLLFLLVLILIEWYLRSYGHNGPANLQHELVWQSPPGYWNPSIVPTDRPGEFQVVCRQSRIGNRDIVDMLLYHVWANMRETFPDKMVGFRLHSPTGQTIDEPHILPIPLLSVMKYRVLEDPRIFRSSPDSRSVWILASYPHHNRFNPQALLEYDVQTWECRHAVPLKHLTTRAFDQKNWTLFVDSQGVLCLLTDLHPCIRVQSVDLKSGVYSLRAESTSAVIPHPTLRCTSAPIRWDDMTLFCAGHSVVGKGRSIRPLYRTVLVWFDHRPPYTLRAYSRSLTCFPDRYIEFASGLVEETPDTFLMSIGLDDTYVTIIRLTRSQLEKERITVG